ncbi:MAG TPA: 5-dehydro-4-deoxy-D-glucuronate isomerase [Nocardioidaceae bacterium]|nr:5-dehydro-4-deoxy-D-glucuronate isomerase [Nocardioidaceae bacterium]
MTEVRYATHPSEMSRLSPEELRARFVLDDLFVAGAVRTALTHHDRILIGGAMPEGARLDLAAPAAIRAEYLCDRREVGIACIEGTGEVHADGKSLQLKAEDIVYVGRGTREVAVEGDGVFYFVSAPAHSPLPTTVARRDDVETVPLGDQANANVRTLRKYVHQHGAQSCELAMGITTIEPGNVWNTMPCHTHDRRTEIYLYFDVPEGERVVHLCGEPERTRSIVMADRQVVISPSWSVHTGAGTASYKFIWATAGENLSYDDMDFVDTRDLR